MVRERERKKTPWGSVTNLTSLKAVKWNLEYEIEYMYIHTHTHMRACVDTSTQTTD